MKRRLSFLPIVLLLAVLVVPMFGTSVVVAQDATPAAPTCVAPELPPGTPTPPDATPAAEEPVAVEEETVIVVREGPASRNLAAVAVASVTNVHDCLDEGNYVGVAALATPAFWLWASESTNPYDFAAGLEEAAPVDVKLTGDTVLDTNGRLGVHIVYGGLFNGPGTLASERWYFTRDGDQWKLDEIKPAPAPDDIIEGITIINVQLVDFAFALSSNSVPEGPVLFRVTNTSYSGQPHEATFLGVTEGTTTESLILMEEIPEESFTGFYGRIFLEPGQSGDVIFENLAAGIYTLACGVYSADGVSHHHLGMVAQLTVEAAE